MSIVPRFQYVMYIRGAMERAVLQRPDLIDAMCKRNPVKVRVRRSRQAGRQAG